ncbi:Gfo/Idh/MocA family protein [Paenibacillus barengoltzii]|uniref:Predicted dehydrogenase n=1 Tax=Paenibacillus barengoltzii J12 TaxID=935846 RepID=A0ABY1LWA6_9BACL|nr:Gfo/Idh/MocA family oxidoreductase [Paenibacillus barengoltzii]SME99097.1 Predicted dehydrogenase [Paenibacillus barengoltzii J12]
MRTVKVGIIGCGLIANDKHMPSLAKVDNVQMVAFCDLIPERAEAAAKKFGTPDAKVFTNYKDLLALEEIEVVHVLTPNSSHASISIDALESGKHVMCEKPMAVTGAEAKAMYEAHLRSGKKLTVGYQSRSSAKSQLLKKMIQNGELGDIYFAKAVATRRRGVPTWGVFLDKEKQGGGPMIDIGTHSLDLILWLMDNYEPESVVGSVFHKLKHTENAANEWGSWDPNEFEVEDSAFGYVKFKNGATVIIETSWALNIADDSGNLVCGTKGGADFNNRKLRINGERDGSLFVNEIDVDPNARELFRGEKLTDFEYEAKQWIHSIVNDTEPLVKPREAMIVSQILEAVYQSAETGKIVYFDQE